MSQLSWQVRMFRHPREAQEFSFGCQAILHIMSNPQETRNSKREALNMMVNELSEKTFKLLPVIEQVITIINMKQDVCEEYTDSESQTDGILEWLPRMKNYRGVLFKEVKKHRGNYQLVV